MWKFQEKKVPENKLNKGIIQLGKLFRSYIYGSHGNILNVTRQGV
jgi:hypothetical protein